MTFSDFYKQNRSFLIAYLIWLAVAFSAWVGYSKVDGHILLNPVHNHVLDLVFRVFTFLGDGLFIIGLAVLLFLLKKRYISLMIIASYVLSGIPVQIVKQFYDAPRPALFLKSIDYAYFVEGVTLHNYNSFPSGHTTSAFALATILAFSSKKKQYNVLLLLLAIVVGYSRIYLSQHFLEDVLAGSVIGFLCAWVIWVLLANRLQNIPRLKEVSPK